MFEELSMKLHSLVLIGSLLSSAVFSYTGNNKPSWVLGEKYESKFSNLPKSAKLSEDNIPWANSFWPHIYGGIAFRWNDFYQTPSFAPLHVQISNIKDEMEKLRKSIFTENMNRTEALQVIAQIEELETERVELLNKKKNLHAKYFFNISRPQSPADIMSMSQAELDKLSPAEKYDVYKYLLSEDDYLSMELTHNVLHIQTNPFREYWEGICNGWTSASLEFEEPEPMTVTAKGITLNFGSSDLKALLSYYHDAITTNPKTQRLGWASFVGDRCETVFPEEAWFIKDGVEYYKEVINGEIVTKKVPENCVDMNAGAFHLVIGNLIGLRNEGFTAEAVRDKEVWNQPVYEYDAKYKMSKKVRANATPGTQTQIKVNMIMRYANDGGRMFWVQDGSDDEFYAWWEPTSGTSNYRHAEKNLEYYIDLDKEGNIIGGMWLSYDRPDFVWVKQNKGFIGDQPGFGVVGYMNELGNLVQLR